MGIGREDWGFINDMASRHAKEPMSPQESLVRIAAHNAEAVQKQRAAVASKTRVEANRLNQGFELARDGKLSDEKAKELGLTPDDREFISSLLSGEEASRRFAAAAATLEQELGRGALDSYRPEEPGWNPRENQITRYANVAKEKLAKGETPRPAERAALDFINSRNAKPLQTSEVAKRIADRAQENYVKKEVMPAREEIAIQREYALQARKERERGTSIADMRRMAREWETKATYLPPEKKGEAIDLYRKAAAYEREANRRQVVLESGMNGEFSRQFEKGTIDGQPVSILGGEAYGPRHAAVATELATAADQLARGETNFYDARNRAVENLRGRGIKADPKEVEKALQALQGNAFTSATELAKSSRGGTRTAEETGEGRRRQLELALEASGRIEGLEAPQKVEGAKKAEPGPQAKEREAGIQRLMSERGMDRDQAARFIDDEIARPNAVPLRPEEDLGEQDFRGMPAEYQTRTITLADGSATTLADAQRARLLRRIDNTEDSVGSTAGVWEAEIMVEGQPRRVAVKVFKDPYVPGSQQRTAQHWNNLFEFVTGRPAREGQPAMMGEAGNLRAVADMKFTAPDGRELPVGPGFYGFVNVDGNIAVAMDLLPGMYIGDMSAAQIREFIRPDTYAQIQKIGETLQANGYGMRDFQFIVAFPPESAIPSGLSGAERRQFVESWRTTINGREVRAGDVVLMDAGGLYRTADEPMLSFSPAREAARARSTGDGVLINGALAKTSATAADANAPGRAQAQADLQAMGGFMREVEPRVRADDPMA